MTSVQFNIVVVIVTLVGGVLCQFDLWNKKCSVIRRLVWLPVPFIPLLGPMIYYALFEPPSVQKNYSLKQRNMWWSGTTGGGGSGAFGGGFGGFGGSFGGGGGGGFGGGGASGGW